jgi:CHAT domain-containing protein
MTGGPTKQQSVRRLVEQLRDFERAPDWFSYVQNTLPPTIDPSELGAFLTDLKDESERYLTVDPRISLRLADSLIYVADLTEQPEHHAFGLVAKGDALRALGRYEESRASFVDARRDFLAHENLVGWARTQTGLLFVSRFLDTAAEALADVSRAQEILVRNGQWLRAAGLCLNAGLVCAELGRYDAAFGFYDQALEFYGRAAQADVSLRPTVEIRSAKARSNQALILTRQGDFRSALTLLKQARDVFVTHGETILVYGQDKHIADVIASQGYYTRALRVYGDAFLAYQQSGLAVDAALVALSRIECYLRLNYFDEALQLADDTIAQFEAAGSPTEAAKARFYSALARLGRGEHERALALLTNAADAFEAGGLSGYYGIAVLHRAGLSLAQNDWSGARDEAERAERIFGERQMIVYRAQAQVVRARALLALGDPSEAVTLAHSVLSVALDRDLAWLAHEAHHVRANAACQTGAADIALSEYSAAIASIERVQGALAPELRTRFLGDKLAVFHEAIDLCLDRGRADLAFSYLERAKSRALVDYLTSHAEVRLRSADRTTSELRDQLARLREEHNWFCSRLLGPGLTSPRRIGQVDADEPSAAEAAGLRAAIRDRERRIASLLEQLALNRADLEAPELIDLTRHAGDELKPPVLDAGTVLLEYYFRSETGAVFVVTEGRVRVVPLAARPSDVGRLVSQWQLNVSATARAIVNHEPIANLGRNARGLLEALWRALLQPVEPDLAGCERLVVIPYGVTHGVPFPALINRSRYLIESIEVTACPSSRLLDLCQDRPRQDQTRALVIAHSNGGRLPGVIEEARVVAELLPGECYVEEKATRRALIEAAPRHGVIHLAAHGEARLDNPNFAHLQLADGQLAVVDVFDLDLRGALVTLSACESGHAVVTSGDELIGLSRGFLYAGAATLVQSLWRVEDRSTAELMALFYRALCSGHSAGAALREAQNIQLAERENHPYFWAAFQLVGASGHPIKGGIDQCNQN